MPYPDFDIDEFVKSHTGKDLLTLMDVLNIEVSRLDRVILTLHRNKRISEWQFREYRDHIGDFLFFLNSGIAPATTGKAGLKRFEPMLKSLVEQGCLEERVLKVLE